jgi:hypothetical protein
MSFASKRTFALTLFLGLFTDGVNADGLARTSKATKAQPASHCNAQETIVFSCPVKGQKIVSVCASNDLTATTGALTYRFGKKNQIEKTLPDRAEGWRDTLRAGSVMYAGGGGKYLGFKSNEYTYVVYSASGRGWGEKSGVKVQRDEEEVSVYRCVRSPTFWLTRGLFERAGLEIEDDKIELPAP